MTKFEQIGVNRQYESETVNQANRAFKHSCDVCCNKGIKIDCERCSIEFVHSLVVACFNDRKEIAKDERKTETSTTETNA